jgi:hypothetical protein
MLNHVQNSKNSMYLLTLNLKMASNLIRCEFLELPFGLNHFRLKPVQKPPKREQWFVQSWWCLSWLIWVLLEGRYFANHQCARANLDELDSTSGRARNQFLLFGQVWRRVQNRCHQQPK